MEHMGGATSKRVAILARRAKEHGEQRSRAQAEKAVEQGTTNEGEGLDPTKFRDEEMGS